MRPSASSRLMMPYSVPVLSYDLAVRAAFDFLEDGIAMLLAIASDNRTWNTPA